MKISEVSTKKRQLEELLRQMFEAFQDETGTMIDAIFINNRFQDDTFQRSKEINSVDIDLKLA